MKHATSSSSLKLSKWAASLEEEGGSEGTLTMDWTDITAAATALSAAVAGISEQRG